jgi:hypothetical protein
MSPVKKPAVYSAATFLWVTMAFLVTTSLDLYHASTDFTMLYSCALSQFALVVLPFLYSCGLLTPRTLFGSV